MTEATTGQGIPVAQLPSRLGWRWIRTKRLETVPDQPIIHLLREKNPGALVNQLSDHLGAVVPHVVLDGGADPAETQRGRSVQMRKLLDHAALGLRDADSWPRIGKLRFRRYALLSWLLKKNLPPANLSRAPHSDARHLLREYLSSRRPRRTQQEEQLESQGWELAAQNLPWYLYVLSLAFFPVYYAWWIRAGRVGRWFMRQPYLSPGESADFPSFAQRLIATPSRFENAEQVRKLLVHAFLADLTDSYKRRLWRWKWVPKDCYPVLLLRNLRDESTGKMLVRLINDVRNETGVRDPLLVIGAGTAALPEEASNEAVTLEQWPEKLQAARRRRSPTAWYVPVRVSDEPSSADDEPPMALHQVDLPLKRSRLVRRVPSIVMVLLLLGGTGAYVEQYFGPCGQLLPWQNSGMWAEGNECVGLADGSFEFTKQLPPGGDNKVETDFLADFTNAQAQIKKQNNDIDFQRGQEPDRPSATIVYFSTLSAPKLYSSTLNGVREELRGLAAAQRNASMNGGPLIRIEFANGGDRMTHGRAVAEQIVRFAEREKNSDSPVIGVIGLGGSWTGTQEAIKKLGAAGLPMVGTTTSADDFQQTSKLYHQVGPDNEQQAQFIKRYLDTFHPGKNLTVYYSGSADDLYSPNLANDLTEVYRPRPAPGIRFSAETRIHCGEQEVAFFTGRADELRTFLNTLRNTCNPGSGASPHVMAGDDITKFMLRDELDGSVTGNLEYTSFYGKTSEDTGVELEGRASLAYDAFNVLNRALTNVVGARLPSKEERGVPVDGLSVWRGIAEIKAPDKSIFGITGHLDYAGGSGQVPEQKRISIMRAVGQGMPYPVWTCESGRCEP